MKEIRAYIRRYDVDDVIEELRAAGAPGVAVIEIHPVGYGYEPNAFEPHVARLVQQYRYLAVVKLEIICRDAQVEPLIRVIQARCRTGESGDGVIFVSHIADAIRISDGARGDTALERKPGRASLRATA
jgi:nitrogen regulatory protein P-II 1